MEDDSRDIWRQTRMRPYATWPSFFNEGWLFLSGLVVLRVDAAPNTQGSKGVGLEHVLPAGLCFWLACRSFRAGKTMRILWNDDGLRLRSLLFGERRYAWSDLTEVNLPSARWRIKVSLEPKPLIRRFGPKAVKMSTKGGFVDPRGFAAIKDVAPQKLEPHARTS